MKPIAILVLAVALETGFLLTIALPAPALARAGAVVREAVVALARAVVPAGRKSPAAHPGAGSLGFQLLQLPTALHLEVPVHHRGNQ